MVNTVGVTSKEQGSKLSLQSAPNVTVPSNLWVFIPYLNTKLI